MGHKLPLSEINKQETGWQWTKKHGLEIIQLRLHRGVEENMEAWG